MQHIIDEIEKDTYESYEKILDNISEYCNPYLCKKFKEYTGVSIGKYWKRRKLTKVLERISMRKESIRKSNCFPWTTPNSFSKEFKNEFGMTPGEKLKNTDSIELQEKINISETDPLVKMRKMITKRSRGKKYADFLKEFLSLKPYFVGSHSLKLEKLSFVISDTNHYFDMLEVDSPGLWCLKARTLKHNGEPMDAKIRTMLLNDKRLEYSKNLWRINTSSVEHMEGNNKNIYFFMPSRLFYKELIKTCNIEGPYPALVKIDDLESFWYIWLNSKEPNNELLQQVIRHIFEFRFEKPIHRDIAISIFLYNICQSYPNDKDSLFSLLLEVMEDEDFNQTQKNNIRVVMNQKRNCNSVLTMISQEIDAINELLSLGILFRK